MSIQPVAAPPRPGRPGPDRSGLVSPELRQALDWALDCRVMTRHLAERLGPAEGPCRVLDAKLEPGVRAIVLYEYAGRLVRGDVDELDSPRAPARSRIRLRLSPFPDDPEIPSLASFVDPVRLGHALAAHLVPSEGAELERRRWMQRCQVDLLRYRPGKRITVTVTIGPDGPRYVVKGYHDAGKAAAVAVETEGLAAAGPYQTLSLAPFRGLVRPGLDGEPALVHAAVTGSPLDQLVGSAPLAPGRPLAAIARAGRALAELHETTHRATRVRPEIAEVERFQRRAQRVAVLDLALAHSLTGLAARLQDLHAQLPAGRTGTVHGDCKPSQFLIGADRVYLLDLDHVGRADQAVDLGTFLASVQQRAIRDRLARRGFPTEVARCLTHAFLVGYAERRGNAFPSAARVAWHQAAALERKALRCFARAPRSPLSPALVAAAHAVLDRLEEGSP